MKNYIKQILTITFAFVSTLSFSQRNADDLLKKVVDKTRSYENFRVDFTYSMVNEKAGVNESKKGILFLKGDAYKLTMEGQTVVSDGKTVWTYISESNEVMVSRAEKGEEAMTPSSLLTSYYKDYKASLVNENRNSVKGLKTIELKPAKEKKTMAKMQLGVNEKKLELVNLYIFDKTGNKFSYDLSKMATNIVLANDFFLFNTKDYPGVEIVDMR